MSQPNDVKVAVIGAGPVGLAAAAHLLERGLTPIVLEAGPEVGASVREWSHVRLFSPWQYNVDKASEKLLETVGWNNPDPDYYPTGGELISGYLEPLATRTVLHEHIRTSSRVTGISRVGYDKVKTTGRENAPFEIRYRNGAGLKSVLANAIIDASGTWNSPNPAGANGLPAIGESASSSRIAYGMPDVLGRDRARYEGRTVAVLGAGHSAAGSIIDLTELAKQSPSTRVVWVLRGNDPSKSFGGGANDKLAARGELGSELSHVVAEGKVDVQSGFGVTHVAETADGLRIGAGSACCGRQLVIDQLIVATGFRPELGFLGELRLTLDPALDCPPSLAPLIDPNLHSCGTVRPHGARELAHPEPGLYVAGIKSYGRAPTFLMATGYEQVRSIAAEIAGDHEAALRVELELPETGVCSANRSSADANASCCGDAAPLNVEAGSCCTASEKAKDASCCTSAADKDRVPA
jgi:thioredoxin reductase